MDGTDFRWRRAVSDKALAVGLCARKRDMAHTGG